MNFGWDYPFYKVRLESCGYILRIPKGTFHRSVSGLTGSIVINQAIRGDMFKADAEIEPISICDDSRLNEIILNTKPIIHKKIS